MIEATKRSAVSFQPSAFYGIRAIDISHETGVQGG